MRLLTFEKELREAQLRSPLSDFALEVQPIEYRRDPLTGMRCRINIRRSERAKQVALNSTYATDLVEVSKKGCFFCPENLERMTPCFSDQSIGQKRIRVGSAVVFPNLYPFGEHHAIAIFSGDHSIPLDKFPHGLVHDCMRACIEYLMSVRRGNPEVKFGSINWNYMPPAGGSMIHPHLQVLAERSPTHLQAMLLQSSEAYFQKHGSNYWNDLVETERKLGERFIHVGESMTWLAAYAPQANDEIQVVFHKLSSIAEMDEQSLAELSAGISKALKGYSKLGIGSLNMSLLSGPLDNTPGYFRLNLRMNSRPRLERYYTSDCGFMERILHENVIESRPEEVATRIRVCFDGAE